MAFTTMQQALDASPGQYIGIHKVQSTSAAAWVSTWGSTGQPGAGADPSSGVAGNIPTKATTGAITFNNAASGTLYLARWDAAVAIWTTPVAVVLYDRLWHNSGVSSTLTTSQTINSTSLTRPDANGDQVEVWWQIYATMGAGTPNITLTYTNQSGTGSRTATSGVLPTAMVTQRTGPFLMAAGDTGVRSIQSWQADATFTSGTIGLVLRRRIAEIVIDPGTGPVNDLLRCLVAKIPTDGCLEFVMTAALTTSETLSGSLYFIEG